MENNMNTEWITDRLPTLEDSYDGDVWVTYADGKMEKRYFRHVKQNTPWQRIHVPEPYVKPKRWTVEFSAYDNTWIMRDNVEGWVRLLYIDRCHRDAAQRIADIYNEVNP
jgi:hypothetical protein